MKATLETSMGTITLELDADKAPETVANFVKYAKDGHYDGTIFHRVIDGFMIQGGGFTKDMNQKETRAPIRNEAMNGLKNKRGTIAMARTMVVDSATSQFFINLVDNDFLDFQNPTPQGFGYAVFGKVTVPAVVSDDKARLFSLEFTAMTADGKSQKKLVLPEGFNHSLKHKKAQSRQVCYFRKDELGAGDVTFTVTPMNCFGARGKSLATTFKA